MTALTSGTSTGVSLRAQLEKLNNFLVFFEEIDRFKIHYIEDLGKDSFSANPRKKSSKDSKEIVTQINTSFCIGTNHFFEDMTFANFSRCIPVNLRRGQFDLSNTIQKNHWKNSPAFYQKFCFIVIKFLIYIVNNTE